MTSDAKAGGPSDHDAKAAAKDRVAAMGIEAGQWFEHYKGGRYQIVSVSIMEDTLVPMVTYRSEKYPHEVDTTRMLENFIKPVGILDHGKFLMPRPRFRREPE